MEQADQMRARFHIQRQQELHRFRHIVRELVKLIPEEKRNLPEVQQYAAWGCGTFMHVLRINATPPKIEDCLREIDFTTEGIQRRWRSGYQDTARILERRPWELPVDPMQGVAVHDSDARTDGGDGRPD